MADPYAPRTYADLIHAGLTRYDDRIAFIDGESTLTYRQTASLVAAFRVRLRAAGMRPGDGVAVLAGNRPETFVAMAAIVLEGGCYTPLHTEASVADQLHVLGVAGVRILCVELPRFAESLAQLRAGYGGTVLDIDPEARASALAAADGLRLGAPCPRAYDDICYLGFSGGTTGKPKGIARSHRVFATNALYSAVEWEWPGRIVFLAATPMSHAAGAMMAPILLRGGTAVTMQRFTPADFARAVERHGVTCTFLVPTMIYRLLDDPDLDDARLAGLETVMYGASRIDPHRLGEAVDRFGPRFMQLYGQAEAPNLISVLRREEHAGARLASCGRPVACATVRIVGEDGRDCAVDEPGEICVRGPIVMDRYHRLPELTAETLREGWLHTGDVGRLDADGFLYVVDRLKDMIVTGGLNVFASEVEDVLGEHPDVAAVAVVGTPDAEWGEIVTACIVLRAGAAALDEAELKALVRTRKGPVHVPKRFEVLAALPLTPLGKPDKKALRDQLV